MKYFILTLFLLSSNVFAKRFANNFIEFELPIGWECQMEGAEWVCQSSVKERGQEAIIIFAAKKRGKMDTLEYYQSYLKNKKTYKLPGGKVQVSEPKSDKVSEINGHRWVDALHLSSEIPGFYTRYLATVKEDLGVAMTFSVSRREYRNYQKVFEKIVNSLRVFRKRGADYNSGAMAQKSKSSATGSIFDNIETLPDELDINPINRRSNKSGSSISDGEDTFLYIVVLIAVVAFFIMRKKK